MKEQENARGVAARNARPFAWNAAGVDGDEFDVVGHWPDRTDIVETLAPLSPADRPGF
jgi:hypothetical protein